MGSVLSGSGERWRPTSLTSLASGRSSAIKSRKTRSPGLTDFEEFTLISAEPHIASAFRKLFPVRPCAIGQLVQGFGAEGLNGSQLPFFFVDDAAEKAGDRRFMRMHKRGQAIEAREKRSEWNGKIVDHCAAHATSSA